MLVSLFIVTRNRKLFVLKSQDASPAPIAELLLRTLILSYLSFRQPDVDDGKSVKSSSTTKDVMSIH
jgi:hypothetical protein